MKCRECGSEMSYNINGNTCSWTCPQCGWGLATSYYDPIELDQTTYTIHINCVSTPSIVMIKCVTKMLSCNSIEAKAMLESGTGSIAGKAPIVKNVAAALTTSEIPYQIKPDFPYPI